MKIPLSKGWGSDPRANCRSPEGIQQLRSSKVWQYSHRNGCRYPPFDG